MHFFFEMLMHNWCQ